MRTWYARNARIKTHHTHTNSHTQHQPQHAHPILTCCGSTKAQIMTHKVLNLHALLLQKTRPQRQQTHAFLALTTEHRTAALQQHPCWNCAVLFSNDKMQVWCKMGKGLDAHPKLAKREHTSRRLLCITNLKSTWKSAHVSKLVCLEEDT